MDTPASLTKYLKNFFINESPTVMMNENYNIICFYATYGEWKRVMPPRNVVLLSPFWLLSIIFTPYHHERIEKSSICKCINSVHSCFVMHSKQHQYSQEKKEAEVFCCCKVQGEALTTQFLHIWTWPQAVSYEYYWLLH